MASVSARQRELYETLLKHDDGPFIAERPAYFSPAAAAQDEANLSPETFIFGVQGPASLSVLERAAGEPLRDIGFSRFRAARVGGLPVRMLRTGISGELGSELHGWADADAAWRARLGAADSPRHDFLGRDALAADAASGAAGRVLVGLAWHPADVAGVLTALLGDGEAPEQMDIDKAHATPGTAVTVIWGRPGTPQRDIRATVTALPFKPDNRRTDVTTG
jgi:hypothetical protein